MNRIAVTVTLCLALGEAFGRAANAQGILYQVGNATSVSVDSGADFEIDVGTVSGVLLVRVWDPQLVNGLPDDDAGKITIVGTAGTDAELQVLVTGPNDDWHESARVPYLATGVRHLGVDSNDGIVVTDAGLRARTRLAAFTSGDIRGTIGVGQVQRLQVGFDPTTPAPGQPPAGTLAAHVTATGHYNAFGHLEQTIEEIVAGNAITGSLTAAGDASFSMNTPSTYANIARIIVGPSENAAGISGDIAAEQGRIAEIWTAGPIARAGEVLPTIRAGNGIKWLRTAVLSSSSYTLVARDVIADINSRTLIDADAENFTYHMPAYGGGVTDGFIESLEVGGDLRGTVRAANLGCSGGLSPLVPVDCTRPGIFVKGIMYANVDVQFNVHHANIVARTMLGTVEIGRFIKGCVVATGGAQTPDPPVPGFVDGHIASLTIGRGTLPQAAVTEYGLFIPGLCGISGRR